jgi:hypothetical protein
MLKTTMWCNYIKKDIEIETNGEISPGTNNIVAKGLLKKSGCPFWGDCCYSKNTMSCDAFASLPNEFTL